MVLDPKIKIILRGIRIVSRPIGGCRESMAVTADSNSFAKTDKMTWMAGVGGTVSAPPTRKDRESRFCLNRQAASKLEIIRSGEL